jgi:hypothetical protein
MEWNKILMNKITRTSAATAATTAQIKCLSGKLISADAYHDGYVMGRKRHVRCNSNITEMKT